jgi:hypothetical protein
MLVMYGAEDFTERDTTQSKGKGKEPLEAAVDDGIAI